MIAVYVTLAIIGWATVGFAGFVYWWTSEFDLDTDDVAHGLFIGLLLGPTAWLVGAFVHSERPKTTLMRRRGGR